MILNPFSVFPDLLVYRFFAPILLRLALAAIYFFLVYFYIKHKEETARIDFPFVGHGAWIPLFSAAAYTVMGGMLLVGYYTQIAALVGILANIKVLVLMRSRPTWMPLPMSTLLLMIVMLCSLMFTGAGNFLALDLPF